MYKEEKFVSLMVLEAGKVKNNNNKNMAWAFASLLMRATCWFTTWKTKRKDKLEHAKRANIWGRLGL